MSFEQLNRPTLPSDDEIRNALARLDAAAANHHADSGVHTVLDSLNDPTWSPVLRGIFAYSPFLQTCLLSEPDSAATVILSGPEQALEAALLPLQTKPGRERAAEALMLRKVRRKVAMIVAMADLAGLWSLDQVTDHLSKFADAAIDHALKFLLLDASNRGEFSSNDEDEPNRESGIIILGMGKYGARELNYSSDIDLIILFDPQRIPYIGQESHLAFATRLTRVLVHLLDHKSKDGFVFRTDLRLRPHPPGYPLALSVDDAETYYEQQGQNWERAALIKAKPIAGDLIAGHEFLERIRPFVWRKYLDYAAIRDIHSIKRQINAYRGFGEIGIRGHDLKVGRGGIREIEFFVQTQQLILGGRHPELRGNRTLDTLKKLVDGRWIERAAAEDLAPAYRLLRALEHRLQMVGDKQTQRMPQRDGDFDRFARFSGFADSAELAIEVEGALRRVETHYAALFEHEDDLGAGKTLVFTGTENDPSTISTLAEMGFRDPDTISTRIRGWHHGHIRATRSTRARELLTELTPALLTALQRQPDIDDAFKLFDTFVTNLPAGVQLFSLIRANPSLLILLCDIMGAAPRLASFLSGHVDLFDAMLSPDFFEPLPDQESLSRELNGRLEDGEDLQDFLDISRRWAHGRQFQAGLHVLLGFSTGAQSSRALTAIAEIVIAAILPQAANWLRPQHGEIEDGQFAVVALGKMGSGELTIGSDLDLVFVYDAQPDLRSTGSKPLPVGTYYARLGQRLVSAISARTSEGALYEIDTRLRPSGNAGPVACSLENFAKYQEATAQTWEQQALTRARVIAGDKELAGKLTDIIDREIKRRRDRNKLADDVHQMRERIFREHGTSDHWNLKHARGGLVELEFLAQFLQLAEAADHPEIRQVAIGDVFRQAQHAHILPGNQAERLLSALSLYHALQAVLRLSLTDQFDPETTTPGMREALVRAANRQLELQLPISAFNALDDLLIETQGDVSQMFMEHCAAGVS